MDPTLYGWRKDELNKVLVPIGLHDTIAAAPDEVLNMVKCGLVHLVIAKLSDAHVPQQGLLIA